MFEELVCSFLVEPKPLLEIYAKRRNILRFHLLNNVASFFECVQIEYVSVKDRFCWRQKFSKLSIVEAIWRMFKVLVFEKGQNVGGFYSNSSGCFRW